MYSLLFGCGRAVEHETRLFRPFRPVAFYRSCYFAEVVFGSRAGVPPSEMLMSAPPGMAVWRRGLAGVPSKFEHPSMETIRDSIPRASSSSACGVCQNLSLSPRDARGCVLSPAGTPHRSPSKQTFAAASWSSSSSTSGQRSRVSASSLSPSCHAAGFGLASPRGTTDYMPFTLAQDAEFSKEVVRSERRASSAVQQRQFGRVASSPRAHVDLAAVFPTPPPRPTAGTTGPFVSPAPPSRPYYGSTGRIFQRGS